MKLVIEGAKVGNEKTYLPLEIEKLGIEVFEEILNGMK
jgi:hypothetical protein